MGGIIEMPALTSRYFHFWRDLSLLLCDRLFFAAACQMQTLR